jgi:hypothetical protein
MKHTREQDKRNMLEDLEQDRTFDPVAVTR